MLIKERPPFSKPLFDLNEKGLCPKNDIYLFIGNNSWKKGKSFSENPFFSNRLLILPPWQLASNFYWPVQESDILVYDTGYAEKDYLYELAQCLFESNANAVRMISPDFELTIYHKE